MEDFKTENLKGFEFKFKTVSGIFSKHGLDGGTKLLIDSMEIHDGALIADLGAGTGIVGMVAAKLNFKGHVHLLDDHLRSINLAQENVDLNKLKNVEVYLSDLFSAVEGRTYHQIFSNPPQQLGNDFLEEVITQSYSHLKPKGELWLVIKNNLKSVIERMLKETFGNYKIITSGREHSVIKTIKDLQ